MPDLPRGLALASEEAGVLAGFLGALPASAFSLAGFCSCACSFLALDHARVGQNFQCAVNLTDVIATCVILLLLCLHAC